MITAIIDAGQHYCQAVSDLWQWDYGQTLRIQGVKLPAAVEVQFSTTERIGETVTRIGVTQEGVTEVPIPDTLLEGSGTTQDYTIYESKAGNRKRRFWKDGVSCQHESPGKAETGSPCHTGRRGTVPAGNCGSC